MHVVSDKSCHRKNFARCEFKNRLSSLWDQMDNPPAISERSQGETDVTNKHARSVVRASLIPVSWRDVGDFIRGFTLHAVKVVCRHGEKVRFARFEIANVNSRGLHDVDLPSRNARL